MNINTVSCPPKKTGQVLWVVKDSLGLGVQGIHKIPCTCGASHIGQTGRSIFIQQKKHQRHLSPGKCRKWHWPIRAVPWDILPHTFSHFSPNNWSAGFWPTSADWISVIACPAAQFLFSLFFNNIHVAISPPPPSLFKLANVTLKNVQIFSVGIYMAIYHINISSVCHLFLSKRQLLCHWNVKYNIKCCVKPQIHPLLVCLQNCNTLVVLMTLVWKKPMEYIEISWEGHR